MSQFTYFVVTSRLSHHHAKWYSLNGSTMTRKKRPPPWPTKCPASTPWRLTHITKCTVHTLPTKQQPPRLSGTEEPTLRASPSIAKAVGVRARAYASRVFRPITDAMVPTAPISATRAGHPNVARSLNNVNVASIHGVAPTAGTLQKSACCHRPPSPPPPPSLSPRPP